MIKEYQVTLVCSTGQYKPVSCIVKKDDNRIAEVGQDAFKAELKRDGVIKICQKRYWTNADLKKYFYTRVKIREYDKEKIEKENAKRYERIKKERGWA